MILKILDTSKSLPALATDQTEGLGRLPEAVTATVTEERNGAFTLEFRLPMTAAHFSEIGLGGLILAKPNPYDDPQMFRIQKISRPIGGIVTVKANHVSYDLAKTSVMPFTATGASAALSGIKNHMTGGSAFTFATDLTNTTSPFTNKIPQSARALFGGQQGSILDTYGGEFEWDNLQVNLLANRGRDRGVRIAYGKNLTDLRQDENIENMYTAVMPYVQDGNGNTAVGTLQTIVETDEPRILNLDLSSSFDITGGTLPEAEEIDAKAQEYIEANDLSSPHVSIDVKFVNLADTEEYKDIARLEEVHLCDTVQIDFPKLGISASAKVNKTVFNVLTEKYESIELGDAKSTLARTILDLNRQAESSAAEQAGFLDSYVMGLTQIITNSLGLFQTIEEQPNGGRKIYLHNEPTLAESQYQWTINSGGFAVSQDYGQTWTAGIDSEGNAVFNSLAANVINALTINGATINGGTIYSGDQYWYYGTSNEGIMDENTVTYDGHTYSGVKLTATAVGIVTDGGTIVIRDYTDKANDKYAEIVLRPNGGVYLRSSVGAFVGVGNTGTITLGSGDGLKSVMVSNSEIALRKTGNPVTNIILNSDGLSIQAGGSTRSRLGFVDDGNGHWVLGVAK